VSMRSIGRIHGGVSGSWGLSLGFREGGGAATDALGVVTLSVYIGDLIFPTLFRMCLRALGDDCGIVMVRVRFDSISGSGGKLKVRLLAILVS
jgi:hypothetical protein